MIQRMQTLWLLLGAACSFFALKLPFYTGNIQKVNQSTNEFHSLSGMENIWLIIFSVSVGVLCLTALFLYKHRKLQQKIGWIIILLQMFVIYLYYRLTEQFINGSYSLGSILQPLILVAIVMAIIGIRKDERIISESDRLR